MDNMGTLTLAAVVFVGGHLLLSHPLRRPLVGTIGEQPFLGLYSLVAFASLGWLIVEYRAAPASDPLWTVGNGIWIVVSVLMLVASVLLAGSLKSNPALPNPGRAAAPVGDARGVYAVTRHPMMWAFALWGVGHVAVYPVAKNIIVAGAITVLALVGAALQDVKKRQLQPEFWPAWETRTSFWPFAAIAAGRASLGSFGALALTGGLVLWLVATWAHAPLAGFAAGVWRWL